MSDSQDFQRRIRYLRNYNGDVDDGSSRQGDGVGVDGLTVYRSFRCPRCQTSISVVKSEGGKSVVCPDCDTKLVVPDYLDFTPTDEEIRNAARSTAKKKRRDELLSPLKNPNRTGVDLRSEDVYGIADGDNEKRIKNRDLFPVYCSVCQTLMHASREQLGLPIQCPDCGTKTIVTSTVRRQLQAEEAKRVVPVPTEKSAKPIKIVQPTPQRTPKSGGIKFLRQKRSSVWDPGANPDKNLPLVLRRKGDGFVWTLGSPPKSNRLFKRTFRTLATPELWVRGGALAALLGAVSAIEIVFFILVNKIMINEGPALSIAWAALNGINLYAFSYWASFFTALFSAGNTGARRVRDWLEEEDLWGKCLYGIFFWSVAIFATGPGVMIASAATGGNGREIFDVLYGSEDLDVMSWGGSIGPAAGFCVFFPIFFLSTLQTNWFFAPICRAVVESWARRPFVWAQFYFASALIVGVPIALFFRHIGCLAAWLAAPIVVPIATTLYALLLGRLSWILDDDIRDADFDD